jgi:hypothetical protein
MKQLILILACVMAGAVGGVLAAMAVQARADHRVRDVVRARQFELVDQTGKPISYWGIDKQKQVVLAFGLEHTKQAAVGVSQAAAQGLRWYPEPRTSIGLLGDGSPFVTLSAADGTSRLRLYLSEHDKPLLLLDDKHGVRVSLGIEEGDTDNPDADDWALDFHPGRARIGMYTVREGEQKYLRGFVTAQKDRVKFP